MLRATIDMACGFCAARWVAWNVGGTDDPQFPDAAACPECGSGEVSQQAFVVRDTRTAS